MNGDVQRDLTAAAYDFLRVVWPAIRHIAGGGRIEPVETTVTRDFGRDLDILAGIDAWQVIDAQGMRGIASRVQHIDPPLKWRTFTVRKSRKSGAQTEHEKRIRAFMEPERGWLMPHLTVHAYITKPKRQGRLLAVAVIRTADLTESMIKHGPSIANLRNPADGVVFDAYSWSNLREHGYRVDVIEPPAERAA